MENPSDQDYINIKRTLKYMKRQSTKGLFYRSYGEKDTIELHAFCDADYAGDVNTREKDHTKDIKRKSTSGCIIMYFYSPIAWGSRLQTLVANR